MNIRKKNALISGSVWIVTLIFIIVFYRPNMALFGYDVLAKLAGTFFIFVAITLDFMLRYKTRHTVIDERDLKIQGKSSALTAIFTVIYVYFFCIIMYEVSGGYTVDADWFWFLGYSTLAVYFITNNFSYFIYESKGVPYEN